MGPGFPLRARGYERYQGTIAQGGEVGGVDESTMVVSQVMDAPTTPSLSVSLSVSIIPPSVSMSVHLMLKLIWRYFPFYGSRLMAPCFIQSFLCMSLCAYTCALANGPGMISVSCFLES